MVFKGREKDMFSIRTTNNKLCTILIWCLKLKQHSLEIKQHLRKIISLLVFKIILGTESVTVGIL